MKWSILQNAGQVIMDPWPHVVIQPALPDLLYKTLAMYRPRPEWVLNGRTPVQNSRYDRNALDALTTGGLPACWQSFVEYHVSPSFLMDILRVFGDAIQAIHPKLYNPYQLRTCSARFMKQKTKPDLHMECQIGMNTPVTEPGRVIGPHVDNPAELFAGLLYMRPPEDGTAGGEFQVCRLNKPKDEVGWFGKEKVPDQDVDVVKSIPYAPNTFVGFISSEEAVHCVTPRLVGAPHRLLVNFAAELNFFLFDRRLGSTGGTGGKGKKT